MTLYFNVLVNFCQFSPNSGTTRKRNSQPKNECSLLLWLVDMFMGNCVYCQKMWEDQTSTHGTILGRCLVYIRKDAEQTRGQQSSKLYGPRSSLLYILLPGSAVDFMPGCPFLLTVTCVAKQIPPPIYCFWS